MAFTVVEPRFLEEPIVVGTRPRFTVDAFNETQCWAGGRSGGRSRGARVPVTPRDLGLVEVRGADVTAELRAGFTPSENGVFSLTPLLPPGRYRLVSRGLFDPGVGATFTVLPREPAVTPRKIVSGAERIAVGRDAVGAVVAWTEIEPSRWRMAFASVAGDGAVLPPTIVRSAWIPGTTARAALRLARAGERWVIAIAGQLAIVGRRDDAIRILRGDVGEEALLVDGATGALLVGRYMTEFTQRAAIIAPDGSERPVALNGLYVQAGAPVAAGWVVAASRGVDWELALITADGTLSTRARAPELAGAMGRLFMRSQADGGVAVVTTRERWTLAPDGIPTRAPERLATPSAVGHQLFPTRPEAPDLLGQDVVSARGDGALVLVDRLTSDGRRSARTITARAQPATMAISTGGDDDVLVAWVDEAHDAWIGRLRLADPRSVGGGLPKTPMICDPGVPASLVPVTADGDLPPCPSAAAPPSRNGANVGVALHGDAITVIEQATAVLTDRAARAAAVAVGRTRVAAAWVEAPEHALGALRLALVAPVRAPDVLPAEGETPSPLVAGAIAPITVESEPARDVVLSARGTGWVAAAELPGGCELIVLDENGAPVARRKLPGAFRPSLAALDDGRVVVGWTQASGAMAMVLGAGAPAEALAKATPAALPSGSGVISALRVGRRALVALRDGPVVELGANGRLGTVVVPAVAGGSPVALLPRGRDAVTLVATGVRPDKYTVDSLLSLDAQLRPVGAPRPLPARYSDSLKLAVAAFALPSGILVVDPRLGYQLATPSGILAAETSSAWMPTSRLRFAGGRGEVYVVDPGANGARLVRLGVRAVAK